MERELRKKIAALLDGQKLGILATQGRSYPYQNIVAFAADRDLKTIVFATRRATSKYRNLKLRRRVAVFVDDRANREIWMRHIGNCLKADPACGAGVAKALGVPLSEQPKNTRASLLAVRKRSIGRALSSAWFFLL